MKVNMTKAECEWMADEINNGVIRMRDSAIKFGEAGNDFDSQVSKRIHRRCDDMLKLRDRLRQAMRR